MRVIATIQADLEVTPLGTKSRLASELGGATVLRRTVERVCLAKSIDAAYVLCPSGQYERCTAILNGTKAIVRQVDAPPPPWGALVQAARKWSLDGWRGGIGQATCFDEYTNCRLISALLKAASADAVLSAPPAAPLFDPALADRMIEHHRDTKDDTRLTFTQAPPGIAGILLDAGLAHELGEKNVPVGWVFSYKPDNPQKDLIFQPCCCEIPAELRYATGRLIADTERSMRAVAALLRDHGEPDPATIGSWLSDREANRVEPLPREVEIELTTDDPYPAALLRPRGSRVKPRGPIDPAVVEQVITEVSRCDDSLVVLGGFGDPLRHPRFAAILEAIRAAATLPYPPLARGGLGGRPRLEGRMGGVGGCRGDGHGLYGLAVRTSAADLSDEHMEAMITHGVDILDVIFDAWTPELYGCLQSPDDPAAADLNAVLRRLDQLTEIRQRRKSVKPIVVPEMTKARENVHELDDFHDGWLRRVGAVTISGYSHFAGQCVDHSAICMAPSTRVACRRIRSRCLVLADGRVAMCDQDFNGLHTLGRIGEQSLEQLWQGPAFERVREAHRQGRFDPTPLCAACDDWHRP